MNRVMLVGNTTQDFAKFGSVVKGGIAVRKNFGNGTNFIDLVVFGQLADFCEQNIKKGTKVFIEGEWSVNKGKDGKKYHSCTISQIEVLERIEVVEQEQVEPLDNDLPSLNDMPNDADDDLPF